jgi:hypothetical protein
MKSRLLAVTILAFPLVVLAAEEAPPRELLENLEFFQNFELMKDKQFMANAAREGVDVEPSTGTLHEGGPHNADL